MAPGRVNYGFQAYPGVNIVLTAAHLPKYNLISLLRFILKSSQNTKCPLFCFQNALLQFFSKRNRQNYLILNKSFVYMFYSASRNESTRKNELVDGRFDFQIISMDDYLVINTNALVYIRPRSREQVHPGELECTRLVAT